MIDPNILPIEELPTTLQEEYQNLEKKLNEKNHLAARLAIGNLLEYYVTIDMEIPEEIEVAYAKLLILENPPSKND